MHLVRKVGATKLVIFANGAIDLAKGKDFREIFQRRTWARGIDAHCLFFSDETTDITKDIRIGWGQGTEDHYYLASVARAVRDVSERLGIQTGSKRFYYGSSAGGFQALMLGAMDEGSTVITNNPQTVWTEYDFDVPVQRVLDSAYGGKTRDEVMELYPERVSAVRAFLHHQNVPRIHYLVNAASAQDIDVALPGLLNGIGELGDLLSEPSLSVHYYWDRKLKHDPLLKQATIKLINRFLAES